MGERNKSPEHTILRQARQPIHKPCLGLHKEHEHTNVQDTIEAKTGEATRKVIVRSHYFQHKKVEKDDCDEKQDRLSEAGIVIGEVNNSISHSDLSNNHMKNKDLKRKISPNDNIQSVGFSHLESSVFFSRVYYYIHILMVLIPPGKFAAQGNASYFTSS